MENSGRIFSLPELHPLHGDEDSYRITPRQLRLKPRYEFREDDKSLLIDDPVWSEEEIGSGEYDGLILELLNHPFVQRLMDVEQLSLPMRYSTMPGSTDLSRWEHALGSLVFTRKKIKEAEEDGRTFGEREKIIIQLRTLLSDIGHTAFSHVGDWLLQGFGGTEDQHDQELKNLLTIGGVEEILRKHRIDLDEVVGVDSQDWVERSLPDLCVDRVDYAVREIDRWIDPYPQNYLNKAENHFKLHGDNLVITSKRSAKFLGVAFGLLATEHWSQPIHRLQLDLFTTLLKGSIVEQGSTILDRAGIRHPIDYLYTTDSDMVMAMKTVGELNNDLHAVMLDVARDQRRVFAWGREREIEKFVSEAVEEFDWRSSDAKPDFLKPLESQTWEGKYSGVKPPNIEIIAVKSPDEVPDFDRNKSTLDVFLKALKPRAVDPLFITSNNRVSRLSRADKHFAKLLKQHIEIQSQAYVARIHLAPDFAAELKRKINNVEEEWERRIKAPRATPEELRRAIGDVAWHAALGKRYNT